MLNSKYIPPFLIVLINFSQSISFVMDFYFLIGYRRCGLKEIPIRVKYLLTGRSINLATDNVAVTINLLDGKDNKNYWSLRLLVPNSHSSNQSFILLLQHFIRDVFITDSVLNSICAFNLMKFQDKFKIPRFISRRECKAR